MGADDIMLGGNLAMDEHPIQGRVVILSVAPCYGNRVKLRLSGLPVARERFYLYLSQLIRCCCFVTELACV